MTLIIRDNGVVQDPDVTDIDFQDGLEVIQNAPGVVLINIANAAIVTAMIVDGSIEHRSLGMASVGTDQFLDESVTLAKIANDTITDEKFAVGGIQTADIGDGQITAGKLDRAYKLSTYTSTPVISTVTNTISLIANAYRSTTACCAAGSVVIGGGVSMSPSGFAIRNHITQARPSGNCWLVECFADGGVTGSCNVQARCMTVPIP